MHLRFRSTLIALAAGFVLAACSFSSSAQQTAATSITPAANNSPVIPDAPAPQLEQALAANPGADFEAPQTPAGQPSQPQPDSSSSPAQSSAGQNQNTQPQPAGSSSTQSSSSSQAQPPTAQETQHQKAEEELKAQEHQRVAGVMATFNTTSNPNAAPLSSGQKYRLFFKSAFDPWPFGLSVFVAGFNQAANADPQWGQGMEGYGKRYGAAYADYFSGNFFGNAVLPSLLREDPRYFQKGSGRALTRFLWAAGSTVWCKRDKGGWGPNYANVGGNLIGAAIARIYYPAQERTVGDTVEDGFTVSAEGIVGAEVIEFWPDMVRHHRRKQAEKQARADQAGQNQQKTQDPNQK